MRARWLRWMLCLLLAAAPLHTLAAPAQATGPALRALLISCDRFVTMPETSPSSFNNLVTLRRALLEDSRGYQTMRAVANRAVGPAAFAALASEAFGDAREGDISLVYLSSHGLLTPQEGRVNFALLLSDGVRETLLDSRALYEALKDIPGTKVLIIDACFSGAAIHKGDESLAVSSLFTGDDFKVLTSAGAREPSFLWTDPSGNLRGGSYFAQALVAGIGESGGYAADTNRDGTVTLTELLRHQRLYYGASSPQVYPEGDNFPLFRYDLGRVAGSLEALTDLSLDSQMLGPEDDGIGFSYTLNQPAHVAYQLIYQREGLWRFETPQSIAEPGGLIPPGRREASLRLSESGLPLAGYVLMLMITVEEDQALPQAFPILGVRRAAGELGLAVAASPEFRPAIGEEAAFFIRHKGPCALTAQILDAEGKHVATLLADSPTRPLHLTPEGTSLYWNGRDQAGSLAAPGRYQLSVSAGGEEGDAAARSPFFRLR